MRPLAPHALHRWTRWVLAAWLCVALGAALSPLARAQAGAGALEPLCGLDGARHWVASPAAQLLGDDAAATGHGLDCPLCLPLLAPPPPVAGQPAALAPGMAPPAGLRSIPWVYRVAAALPARGPPHS
ncbi:hypothetical protein IB233_19955 [Comamonas sp. CMM01]|uniref:hypothetical protein n=1 Tax=Comamonas sp. CMM01 TaxID=2769280 RepID=UPI00177DD704|nr:hypothetical protein [Comamonas sp. CMM01]MBD9533908.1 hypothetical protein [Comamonas sp. CMM01]